MLFGNTMKPKVGLTLSGGGMRGIGHIAVLKALEEYNLQPQVLSGTSAGSIVGAFYSLGKSPVEMMEIVKESTFFTRSTFKFSKNGIFNPGFKNSFARCNYGNDFWKHQVFF
jgi:NTE family protein